MSKRFLFTLVLLTVLTACANTVFAQPAWTIDLLDKEGNKAAKYNDKQLGSEKAAEKKFTRFRHFVQNTIVHFNYYYDANNRVNLIIEQASIANKDDYTQLLSFYPYSLKNTLAYKKDLDSVILKCTAAILLHDLRNDWVDNMYLLLGKTYFLRNNLDSAEAVFQFINYNLFPRKKGEDDDRIVGANEDATNGTLSIANKEHLNFLQKLASQPPSRNDALIWLAHTLIEENNYGDAAGLINTLQGDPNLPLRLKDDVEEADAYLFFKQHIYDSAANHLEKALTNATNKADLARREFLLAQLFEMNKNFEKASVYYNKAAIHTVDPLMDIYAQVDNAKMQKSTDPKQLDIGIANLLKMARKDKFETYRPILYYSAGQLAMQKPDTAAATNYYFLALRDSTAGPTLTNKSLVALGDIAFTQRNYQQAYREYDSLVTGDTAISDDRLAEIHARRNLLEKIVVKENIINKEDSLQQIAAMPPAQRTAFVKKLSKKLSKDQSNSKEDADFGQTGIDFGNTNQPTSIFDATPTGEWYFYNTALRSQGNNDFKTKWGNRPNVDNWNRKSALDIARTAVENPNLNTTPGNNDAPADSALKAAIAPIEQPKDQSFVGLMEGLPLTPEKLAESNKLVYTNLYALAKVFQDEVKDYGQAIEKYERSLLRFPDSLHNGDIYLGLYFCYNKLGNTAKADYYKKLLTTQFPGSRAESAALHPEVLSTDTKKAAATQEYKRIYNLFIEGSFDEAVYAKQKADSLYGDTYWTPQLLYIESVYYIKACGDDTSARKLLLNITANYKESPVAPKAARLLDVLARKPQIESYLTNLKITRAADSDKVSTARVYVPVKQGPIVAKPVVKDSTKTPIVSPVTAPNVTAVTDNTVHQDSLSAVPDSFSINTAATYNVIMVMDKVDRSYAGEAKNAIGRYNDENFYGQNITAVYDTLDVTHSLVVIATFKTADDAMVYYAKLKKAAPNELSWLPANKYSFLIITNKDLNLLKTNKNIDGYKRVLNKVYPGKF